MILPTAGRYSRGLHAEESEERFGLHVPPYVPRSPCFIPRLTLMPPATQTLRGSWFVGVCMGDWGYYYWLWGGSSPQ